MENKLKYMHMYIKWNHFALYLKLIQYCKPTIVQLKKTITNNNEESKYVFM